MRHALLGLGLALLAWGMPVRAAIDLYTFDSAQQEQTFRELTRELRCPKCQNQDIADSNASLARDLRDKSYQMVRAGKSKQEVIDYMVARYGNFILYDPPLMFSTLILWLAPIGVMVGGIAVALRRTRRPATDGRLTEAEQQRLARLLDEDKQA